MASMPEVLTVTLDLSEASLGKLAEAVMPRLIRRLVDDTRNPFGAPSQGVPAIGMRWIGEGGIYAGVARGRDGGPDYHLVVSDAEQVKLNWLAAMDWAKGLEAAGDWSLPTRAEQALLFANVPEPFERAAYWSCEQYAGDAQYAWSQGFTSGYQFFFHKSNELRARAVRRVPIQ